MRVSLIVVALAAGLASSAMAAEPSAFRRTLDAHLAAVSGRNLEALIPTLTSGPELTLLLPDGTKLDTRQQFIDLHREWFASGDAGKWEPEVVRTIEASDQAVALVRYRNSSRGADGAVRASTRWLTLTFAREGGRWGLVLDQNTTIANP